ncbi:uroporphyrinogen-III synthase [Rossellomorea vietnamensis]|uniref:Uroporphyrinogen-III synthase n=1 Tax=Rossellomorea vietnamensis TaxID=218284 RepID=A0A5D4P4P8_9BACI|nr:uroporphyrinogen-III synthase [Rossellomorea vietnamensis]TYS19652.1 uroporphyrinogen-III synthase [Rossellomorea vietnamensis]
MDSSLPLRGMDILVTREAKNAEGMADTIRKFGGIPHIVPLISFRPHKDEMESTYLKKLKSYEWIFFTSKNGVHFFFEKLKNHFITLNGSETKFAAVGEKTCKALNSYGIQADFVPKFYSAADFSGEFLEKVTETGPILLSKGNLAKDTIAVRLRETGITIDEWITYETFFPKDHEKKLIGLLENRALAAITFTSPSTVKSFMKIVRENLLEHTLDSLITACIGPVTKEAADQNGLAVQVIPEKYTVEEMIEGLAGYFALKKKREE